MKKVIIGILVLMSLLISLVFVFAKNDYAVAEQFAKSGQYQLFFETIKDKVKEQDKTSIAMLIDYALKAVQENDFDEAKYYFDQNNDLVNMQNEEGARAVDALLIADEQVNLQMLTLLLSYQPQLNYFVPYFDDMTPLQMVASRHTLQNDVDIINQMIQHGANPNFFSSQGSAKTPALFFSYIADNFEVFQALLKNSADVRLTDHNGRGLPSLITGSYLLEFQKKIPKLNNLYATPLNQEVLDIVQSSAYRTIHQKNMRYLQLLLNQHSMDNFNEQEILNLAIHYATTNEFDALKLFVEKGVCNIKNVCSEIYQKALLNNNRAIMAIIK